MKKLCVLISIIMISVSLVGCAASGGPYSYDTSPSIYSSMVFDWDSFTYTNYDASGILKNTGNPTDDFVILYQHIYGESSDNNTLDLYTHLILLLDNLSTVENMDFETILNYNSSELKTAIESHQMSLALNDIVIFNDLKEMKNNSSLYNLYISKIQYIEKRLSISLTEEQISALDYLQIQSVKLYSSNSNIKPGTSNSIPQYDQAFQEANFDFTQDQQALLNISYNILNMLVAD